jgi:hypothetical protein
MWPSLKFVAQGLIRATELSFTSRNGKNVRLARDSELNNVQTRRALHGQTRLAILPSSRDVGRRQIRVPRICERVEIVLAHAERRCTPEVHDCATLDLHVIL